MDAEINKDVIFNHFARKSSPLQREMIAQWLCEKANEEQYYEWLEEWETKHPQYLTQPDKPLQHYIAFLETNPHVVDNEPVDSALVRDLETGWTRRQWLVAASVILLVGVSLLFFRDQIRYETYETAFGETRSFRLADGSLVMLNANSTLQVPRWGFGTKTRQVRLTGEANFSVTHTPDNQRFVVKTTKNIDVIVLGTEFSVFSRNRGAKVVLSKGKVQLNYQEGQTAKQLVMKPGDLVSLDSRNHLALKTLQQPQEQSAWREKRFVFDETSLQEVAYLLEENYGLTVTIGNQDLANRILMGSFKADNVDQLLQSISELLDVNVVRQGNQVQIQDQ